MIRFYIELWKDSPILFMLAEQNFSLLHSVSVLKELKNENLKQILF